MPAHQWEIEGAVEEGVNLMPCWGPHKILSENGRVVGMELINCISVFDDQGNFSPSFGETKEILEGDQIIISIGQDPDLSFLLDETPIVVKNGLIIVNPETLETGMKGVYAGGDVAAVAGSIINAIACGRKASSSIDKALGGTGDIEEVLFDRKPLNQYLGRDEGFATWQREKIPTLELGARHDGFEEVSLGYERREAIREAKRCLQCDLRLYMNSNPSPPQKWLTFDKDHINQVPETEGVFHLYDEYHNVLVIKGTPNLRNNLGRELELKKHAVWFDFEEDKMYSKRESELIQQYLQEHGETSAYKMAKDLEWTTGKIHAVLNTLVESNAVVARVELVNGRATKFVKLKD